MQRILCLFVLIYSLSVLDCSAQSKVVVDRESNLPIPDVAVFISNTSIGTSTDVNGSYNLNIADQEGEYLIFSHLNYSNKQVLINSAYIRADTIRLALYEESLTEVSVKFQEKKALRKRRLRRFMLGFLGQPKYIKKVNITNADKILLYKENEALVAEISEPINIVNSHLGYEIDFYLEQFKLLENDDLFIKGSAYFKEIKLAKNKMARIKHNRNKLFQGSSRMFFYELVRNELSDRRYKTGRSSFIKGNEFADIVPIPLDSLQIEKGAVDIYTLAFKGLLTIGLVDVPVYGKTLRAEKSLGVKTVEGYDNVIQTTYYSSKTNMIKFNSSGRILNPLDIEEYGYWSKHRIASILPGNFNYEGFSNSNSKRRK